MRNLDDAQRSWPKAARNLALDLGADVSREDNRDVAPPQFEHDGVVVARILAFPVGQRRMPDNYRYAVHKQRVVGLHVSRLAVNNGC